MDEETKEQTREIIAEEFHKRGINGGPMKELRADFYWLRSRRLGETRLKEWAARAFIGILVTGICSAVFAGFVSYL